jgi:hypothetical protein
MDTCTFDAGTLAPRRVRATGNRPAAGRAAYWTIVTSVPNISSATEITRELAW